MSKRSEIIYDVGTHAGTEALKTIIRLCEMLDPVDRSAAAILALAKIASIGRHMCDVAKKAGDKQTVETYHKILEVYSEPLPNHVLKEWLAAIRSGRP